jgi:ribonuclease HI
MATTKEKLLIEAYVDGACRGGNPGFCSCAYAIYFNGKLDTFGSLYLGPERKTNNHAEYMALITLLEILFHNNIRNVTIHSDSKLVVNQVLHNWECNGDLRPLMSKAYGLYMNGGHILRHVKGHEGNEGNEFVDKLCNEILDEQEENATGNEGT